jgi:hypothetical protein
VAPAEGPQPRQHVQPVDRGQGAVDDQHVVPAGQAQMQHRLPVGGELDRIALAAEQLG